LGPGPGSPKIGLGLWNHRAATTAAELAVLFTGGLIYLRATRRRDRTATAATAIFGVILIAATVATPFMPVPPSPAALAVQPPVSYAAPAFAAAYVDRRRFCLDGTAWNESAAELPVTPPESDRQRGSWMAPSAELEVVGSTSIRFRRGRARISHA